jgi:hypothetical protein
VRDRQSVSSFSLLSSSSSEPIVQNPALSFFAHVCLSLLFVSDCRGERDFTSLCVLHKLLLSSQLKRVFNFVNRQPKDSTRTQETLKCHFSCLSFLSARFDTQTVSEDGNDSKGWGSDFVGRVKSRSESR